MRYFSPDLLLRFGSRDDTVANAAQEEWEIVHQQYLSHLEKLRPKLPRGVRPLLRKFCLHDARLIALGLRHDKRDLFLLLELARPQHHGLTLTYDLTRRPALRRHATLSEEGTPIEWLYDELSLVKGGESPSFRHSVLFTGGRELELTFRDLRLMSFENVLGTITEAKESDLDALLAG